jgi:uncharacterized protein (UPF0371 family)
MVSLVPISAGLYFMRSHALLITFTETSNNAIQLYSRSKNREAHSIYILSQNTHNVLRDILGAYGALTPL